MAWCLRPYNLQMTLCSPWVPLRRMPQPLKIFSTGLNLSRYYGLICNKSKLYKVGEMADFGELVEEFGCEIDTFPTIYPGLSLGSRSLLVTIWDSM